MDFTNGLAPDPRNEEQKSLDYLHRDTAGDVIINWVEKPKSEWKKYTPRLQNGSLSCCGQASAKAVEILNNTIMSAHPPYRSRSNYSAGGMYLQDVGSVWKNIGSTMETLDPSQMQNEATMNRDITVTTPVKIGGYVTIAHPKEIDKIAEAIELHKHCILIVHCAKSEWTVIPVFNGATIDFGHAICAVDYFLHNGVKTLLIEDSTGHFNSYDKNGQRLITEDFLAKRFEGAMYFTLEVPVIKHTFYKLLKYGMRDSEVAFLQKVLKIPADGIFGKITLKSVQVFQANNSLIPDGICGKLTNAVLNTL